MAAAHTACAAAAGRTTDEGDGDGDGDFLAAGYAGVDRGVGDAGDDAMEGQDNWFNCCNDAIFEVS